MFWEIVPDHEEWAEPGQLLMHNLLLNCLKYTSKEPVVTVQVNVRLNCSFLNVMSLQAFTYDCFSLQSFLAVSLVKLCLLHCVKPGFN